MTYPLENIYSTIAKVLECMARDPKRAERLLGKVKGWVQELSDAAPQASAEVRNAALEEAGQVLDRLHDENRQYHTEFRRAAIAIRALKSDPAVPTDEQCMEAAAIASSFGAPDMAAALSAKGAGDVALPPLPSCAIQTAGWDGTGVAEYYTADQMRAYALADRQQRSGDHFRDATKMVSTEDLHVTHRPLIREAVALLRLRRPVTPDFERVASELETALNGLPTPAGAPSQEWLEVAALAAQPAASIGLPIASLPEGDVIAHLRPGATKGELLERLGRLLAHKPDGGDAEPTDSSLDALINVHELVEDNPYCYFELAHTRQTGWMAWITDKPLYPVQEVANPDRKVLARGQGDSAEEACRIALAAISAQQGGRT